MGRSLYGLVAGVALLAGCAAAAPSAQQSMSSLDDGGAVSDLGGACVDGAACLAPNPGACNSGHVVCSGAVASCVPDATTQSCYSGPAGTQGVGVCKAGTQTCIGALGTCGGELLPAAQENCFNDFDDDCDGKVNNGCPDHVAIGTPRALTARGNAAGGGAFSLRCPAGSFVSKAIIYADTTDVSLGGIDISCATPTLVRGASAFTITEAASASPGSAHAANISLADNLAFDCGTTGFVPAWYSDGSDDAAFVRSLGVSCATAVLTLSATNQLSFTFSKQTGGGNYYGYPNSGTAFEDDCSQGEVLIGFDGHKGNGMDSTQAVCAPLSVVYK